MHESWAEILTHFSLACFLWDAPVFTMGVLCRSGIQEKRSMAPTCRGPLCGAACLPCRCTSITKSLHFIVSRWGRLEDMRSLARPHYPVTPHTSHPPKVPCHKGGTGAGAQPLDPSPHLSPSTPPSLGTMPSRKGGWSCSLGHSRGSCAHWFWFLLGVTPLWWTSSTLSRHIPAAALGGRVPVPQPDYGSFPRA